MNTSTLGKKPLSNDDDYLDSLFFALSDRTRRNILKETSQRESNVSELAQQFDISLPGMLKHLRIMEKARLLSLPKDGRVRKCKFKAAGLSEVGLFLKEYKQFWKDRFDNLEKFIEG